MNIFAPELWEVIGAYASKRGWGDFVVPVLLILLIGGCIGGLIGWFAHVGKQYFTAVKAHRDAEKSVAQTRSTDKDVLAALFAEKDKLHEQTREMDKFLYQIREHLRYKQVKKLREARDLLCMQISQNYMPVFEKYVEMCQIIVLSRTDRFYRMAGDVLPAMETIASAYEMANHEKFLESIGESSPIKLKFRSCDILFARIRRGIPFWKRKDRKQLKSLRKRWAVFLDHG